MRIAVLGAILFAAMLAAPTNASAVEKRFDLEVEDGAGHGVTAHVLVGEGARVCGPLRITGQRDGEDHVLYQLSKGHCL